METPSLSTDNLATSEHRNKQTRQTTMCPRIEPDFDKVFAQTPVWPKGLYELVMDKLTSRAYDKTEEKTGKFIATVAYVGLRPKLVGVFDSAGKLSTEIDGTEIAGQPVEEIRLYLHSQGAREFSKRQMMAILGYEAEEEKEYNEYVKSLDLSFDYEENPDAEGYIVTLGDGWQVLVGKHVKAQMSKGSYKNRDQVDVERQEFDGLFPVNTKKTSGKKGKAA